MIHPILFLVQTASYQGLSKSLANVALGGTLTKSEAMQMGLFDMPVHVGTYVKKNGTVVTDHVSSRKKRPVLPKRSPTGGTPDLFANPEPRTPDLFMDTALRGALPEPVVEAPPFETPVPEIAVSDLPSVELKFDAFGVQSGITKPARRKLNAKAADLANSKENGFTAKEKTALAKYSGTGGVGDSLNEFYTRPDVAAAMWSLLDQMGVSAGTVLEPSCGTGVFLHTAPDPVTVVGVELDDTSAKIARALHERHEVQQSSMEGFATSDVRQFDAVIGNVPFGVRGSLVSDDKPDLPTAEQYFLDTAIDKTKSEGIVALIVPTGIMDNANTRAYRESLLKKAQFVAAYRLPNTAFSHSHTSVTSDVVVFRKRAQDVAGALRVLPSDVLKAVGGFDEAFVSGQYFTANTDHVFGTPEAGWRSKAGMGNDFTVAGTMDGVAQAITASGINSIPSQNITMENVLDALGSDEVARRRAISGALAQPYEVANLGDTKTENGVTYVLQGQPPRWHRVGGDAAVEASVTDGIALGNMLERMFADKGNVNRKGVIEGLDEYVRQHGIPAKNKALQRAAQDDKALWRLIGAVNSDGTYSNMVMGPSREDGADLDAVARRLILDHGTFTVEELAQAWHGGDAEAALDHLMASKQYAVAGDAKTWTDFDNYLTGELWPKLDGARAALQRDDLDAAYRTKYELQASALNEAIGPKTLEDVELMLNSGWVPLPIIERWQNELKAAGNDWMRQQPDLKIAFNEGVYHFFGGTGDKTLLDKYLNRSGVRQDDMPRVDEMNRAFKDWVLTSDVREQMEDLYNRTFLGFHKQHFSDAPIQIPGLTTERAINSYHYSNLRWALQQGKGIIADDVGLGKSVQGLCLAKLAKAYGQAKKPMIVVPKSVLANWLEEIDSWFPGSKVLTIGETVTRDKNGKVTAKSDNETVRNTKYHELSQNSDYDFVLITQPAWNDLDLNPIKKGEYVEEDFWVQRADSMGKAGDKQRNKIREQYKQAMAGRDFRKRSDAIWFEELGVDMVVVDEGHCFPAGTMVDGRPIETLAVGDVVKSFNVHSGFMQDKPITGIMRRQANSLVRITLKNRVVIESTPEHPFFTRSGYTSASQLSNSSYVMMLVNVPLGDVGESSASSSDTASLYGMQQRIHVERRTILEATQRNQADVLLFKNMCIEGGLFETEYESPDAFEDGAGEAHCNGNSEFVADRDSGLLPLQDRVPINQGAAILYAQREATPLLLFQNMPGDVEHEQGWATREVSRDESEEEGGAGFSEYTRGHRQASCDIKANRGDRWERTAAAAGAPDAGRCAEAPCGSGDSVPQKKVGSLQSGVPRGYCRRGSEVGGGSGRTVPQVRFMAGAGQEENRGVEWVGVDSIEVLEQTSDGRFGGLCCDGFVYDIEVEGNHNFFAKGILVHNCYKNLYAARNRFGEQPKFLGGSGLSNRAHDTYLKAKYVRESNSGKGVYMLSASPVKNSPLEVYSMLSHVAPEAFDAIGVGNSEAFLDRFCVFENDNIVNTQGQVENALVTAGFKNLDELRTIMAKYINRRTALDVGLKIPDKQTVEHLIDMSPDQEALYVTLREQAKKAGGKDENSAHIFSVMSDMGKAAIDLELVGPEYAGAHSPKLEAAADAIARGSKDGGQVVFSDFVGTHQKLRALLMARGLGADEIGIINASETESSLDRQAVSNNLNSGKLKVVIGNTATMGEGVNLQKLTTDIHNLDQPWEPASMQQRLGRAVRQGNRHAKVRVHAYLSKGSFDGYRYQTIAAKRDWQDALWHGADTIENLSRVGKIDREELLIMLAANPDEARAAYAANKGAALEREAAKQRGEAAGVFVKFQEIKRSYAGLKNKGSETAARVKTKLDKYRLGLRANKYFTAKEALDLEVPVVVQPQTGTAWHVGRAFEMDHGPDAPINWSADKKSTWVVTGVGMGAGRERNELMVTARPYGSTATQVCSVPLSKMNKGIAPIEYDAAQETKTIEERAASLSETGAATVKNPADLKHMSNDMLTKLYPVLQKQLKDSARAYRDGWSGPVGMINGEGEPVVFQDFNARKHLDAHDLIIPTKEHRQLAMNGWVAMALARTVCTRYTQRNKRSQSVENGIETVYPGFEYGQTRGNPWGYVGEKLFGQTFVDEARVALHHAVMDRIENVATFASAMNAAEPSVEVPEYGGGVVKWPKAVLTALWAQAQKEGITHSNFDAVLQAGVASGKTSILHRGLLSGRSKYGNHEAYSRSSTVLEQLYALAQDADLKAIILGATDGR